MTRERCTLAIFTTAGNLCKLQDNSTYCLSRITRFSKSCSLKCYHLNSIRQFLPSFFFISSLDLTSLQNVAQFIYLMIVSICFRYNQRYTFVIIQINLASCTKEKYHLLSLVQQLLYFWCSAFVDVNGCLHQNGTATNCKTSNRTCRESYAQR